MMKSLLREKIALNTDPRSRVPRTVPFIVVWTDRGYIKNFATQNTKHKKSNTKHTINNTQQTTDNTQQTTDNTQQIIDNTQQTTN